MGLIPESEIEGMHKVAGRVGGARKMTDADRRAFALVAPFARGDAVPAINPEWRAPEAEPELAVRAFLTGVEGEAA